MGIFAKIVKWVMSFVRNTDISSESIAQAENKINEEGDKTDAIHKENTEIVNNITGNIDSIDDALDYINSKYGGGSG